MSVRFVLQLFEALDLETLRTQVDLLNVSVKFVYQGHRVKVNVTEAKISYKHN